jgi:hypothetical protein
LPAQSLWSQLRAGLLLMPFKFGLGAVQRLFAVQAEAWREVVPSAFRLHNMVRLPAFATLIFLFCFVSPPHRV